MKDTYNSDIKITCQPTTIINNNFILPQKNNSNNNLEFYDSNKNEILFDGTSILNEINNINNNTEFKLKNSNNSSSMDKEEIYTLDGASIIENGENDKNNWENETRLEINNNSISLTDSIDSIRIKSLRVLITGCTGYLGSNILVQLLRIINCETVYCLVRGVKSTFRANEKINKTLKQYQLYDQISEREFQKIIPVIGDLEKEKFGLSENEYQHLSKSVHFIINLASNNNINSTYNECKSTNVNGVKELIKLSTSISFKRIVHISPSFLLFNQDSNNQNDPLPTFSNQNGYLNSKSASEHLINKYSQEYNIPNMILRSPFIISNKNGLISSIIESCISCGFYPNDLEFKTNLLPIQWLSETIINTIFNDNNWVQNNNQNKKNNCSGSNNALNVFNIVGEPITLKEIFSIISKEYQLSSIEFNDWVSKLKSIKSQNEIILLLNNLQFIKSYPNNYKQQSNHINTTNYKNSKITKEIIKKLNFKINK